MRFAFVILLLTLTVASGSETASVGFLTMDIPSGFREVEQHQKDSLGDLEVNRWETDDGRVLQLLYYAGFPKQDRGPMVISSQESIEVVGQKTRLIQTSMFFGAQKKLWWFTYLSAIPLISLTRNIYQKPNSNRF
jgi:hypothetical protein